MLLNYLSVIEMALSLTKKHCALGELVVCEWNATAHFLESIVCLWWNTGIWFLIVMSLTITKKAFFSSGKLLVCDWNATAHY